MLQDHWSRAKLTTPNHLIGWARWGSTLILNKLTYCSNYPFRWLMPNSTMALSTLESKINWCRLLSLIVVTWQWHKLWRPGWEDLHLVSCCSYILFLSRLCYSRAEVIYLFYIWTGPAGTGKTESVKALGHQLGRFVLVFNCDETFDFQV